MKKSTLAFIGGFALGTVMPKVLKNKISEVNGKVVEKGKDIFIERLIYLLFAQTPEERWGDKKDQDYSRRHGIKAHYKSRVRPVKIDDFLSEADLMMEEYGPLTVSDLEHLIKRCEVE